MVSRYALIAGGVCTNVVNWDGNTETWAPPEGVQAVPYNPALHVVGIPVEAQNRSTIEQQAVAALASNRTYVASTPTAAQTTAQVKALSRQMNGLIRLMLGQLDGTD